MNCALARYFVLYLQERGALAGAVARMRARAAIAFDPDTGETTILRDDGAAQLALIAGSMNRDSAELEADFLGWLQTVLPRSHGC